MFGDVDKDLRELVARPGYRHVDAARRALRFRSTGDAADLVAVLDDPHPCAAVDVIFALAGAERPWLNWVPMPTEAITNVGELHQQPPGGRRDHGRLPGGVVLGRTGQRDRRRPPVVAGSSWRSTRFPNPTSGSRCAAATIRSGVTTAPIRSRRCRLRLPTPYASCTRSPSSHGPPRSPSRVQAEPLGRLPLADLLGLLAHLPGPPDTERWRFLAESTPTYWYRLLQPWVCLGLLSHREDEPWPTSTRRRVLTDLAFGIEDWVCDAALFALVTAAYQEPALRSGVRAMVRRRLDAAAAADRLVTIEESLARLMLITPGCTAADRALASVAIARAAPDDDTAPAPPRRRRWWHRTH